MGNNNNNYDDGSQQQQLDDDFYSLNTVDDYSSANQKQDAYNYWMEQDDDVGNFYSTQKTLNWFDNMLRNTTAGSAQDALVPVEDINPDNVLATFLVNVVVCIILLSVYEILRRLIPSVYSQRIVHAQRKGNSSSNIERQFASLSKSHASGSAVSACQNSQGSKHHQDTCEYSGYSNMGAGDDNTSVAAESTIDTTHLNTLEKLQSSSSSKKKCCCASGFLEWFCPIYSAPWSTFRDLAGLDAYFFLRYIRMNFKITAVSTIWAAIILCPVYATGGGGQTGFYHFSMANILQDDKGRVWVPTFFCYAFTLYCWFCVRREIKHYVELRMVFLGGGEEEGNVSVGNLGRGENGEAQEVEQRGYGPPSAANSSDDTDTSKGTSSLLPASSETGSTTGNITEKPSSSSLSHKQPKINKPRTTSLQQHRYSLQVEKIPVALRSNTALFNYFNDMFPGQVHSACIAMNVPDLDNLSARRSRVCRRLEKSLAYYNVTGIRPTHIAGRPRCYFLGIESTPIDAMCLAFCCCVDSCRAGARNSVIDDDDDEDAFPEFYDELPGKGEKVDSISYYIKDLALCNLRMQDLQKEKLRIAQGGGDTTQLGIGMEWYTETLVWAKQNAKMAAEGLREEFEVLIDEDEPLPGHEDHTMYGSFETNNYRKSKKSETSLVRQDHLVAEEPLGSDSSDSEPTARCHNFVSKRRHSKAYQWLRAMLWRGGVDFLAAGLDEVRNSTDVVVDSITCPSMSSTGFVTFKTLTPVTVSTSVPLTYNNDPIDVCIAPEPRDLKWKNAPIDKDIGATREFIANIFLSLGILLWSIPLTLIQAWAKVDNVARIPGLEWIATVNDGAYKSLINGYLPVVVLLILICLLPFMFDAVATYYEKRKTFSEVENSIVGRYFYYQLANIYITVTAGALWTSLGAIIDHPQHLLYILGNTLPKLAGYFISLLLTKTLAGLPITLLRFGSLFRMGFLRSCFNRRRLTQRELDEVHRKQPIYYGWEYPTQFLAIIICFTYACITPLILPVGATYFFFALQVYKKQSLYVYTPTYDSGGSMFPQAISKTMFALMISQLTFIGYTLIRKGVFQVILLAPLPFLTVFYNRYISNRFVNPSTTLSLERAVKIDALYSDSQDFSDEAYRQPVLTEKTSLPRGGDCERHVFDDVMRKLDILLRETPRGEHV